jgi:hydrogenase maturation factor HypF (carbamoyltransferase family)
MDKRVCPVCGNEYSKEDLKSLNSRYTYPHVKCARCGTQRAWQSKRIAKGILKCIVRCVVD